MPNGDTARSGLIILRRGPYSLRLRRAAVVSGVGSAVVALVLIMVGLSLGDYTHGPLQVLRALTGSGDPLASYFVLELRAPRVATALAVGAALGISGALFQTVTENPLGSPDILGFTTGAATGALIAIIIAGADGTAVTLGALVGAGATALAVRLLVGPGGMGGPAMVLVGLGVGATLAALNTLLVVRASLERAQSAGQWMAGSLHTSLWGEAALLLVAVTVAVMALAPSARDLDTLSLGNETAVALGVDVRRTRTRAVVIAVTLAALATAATGPIAFIALAAPQISRRLSRRATPGIAGSALTGAVLVLAADLVAQHALPGGDLAVGVVTGALGGIYLIYLLATDRRNR